MAASIYVRLGPWTSLPLHPLLPEDNLPTEELASEHHPRSTSITAKSALPLQREEESLCSGQEQTEHDVENSTTAEALSTPANVCMHSKDVATSVMPSTASGDQHAAQRDGSVGVLAPTQPSVSKFLDQAHEEKGTVSQCGREDESCLGQIDEGDNDSISDMRDVENDADVSPPSPKDPIARSSRFRVWRLPGQSPLVQDNTLSSFPEPDVGFMSPSEVMEIGEDLGKSATTVSPPESSASQAAQGSQTVWLISRDNDPEKVDWIPFWCKFLYARSRHWLQHPEALEAEMSTRRTTRTQTADAPVPTPERRNSGRGTPRMKKWRRLEAPPSPFTDNVVGCVEAQRTPPLTASTSSIYGTGSITPNSRDGAQDHVFTNAASFLARRRMEIRAVEEARRRELEAGEQESKAQDRTANA